MLFNQHYLVFTVHADICPQFWCVIYTAQKTQSWTEFWNSIFKSQNLGVIIAWTPPPFCRGGGVEPPTKFSKRGGLTESQFLEGDCLERGG